MTEDNIEEPITEEPVTEEESPVPVEETVLGELVDDEECPQCQISEMMTVLSVAHTSCHLVEDQTKRDECVAWAEALDPERIDDIKKVARELVEHAGIEGIDRYTRMVNTTLSDAIVDHVQEKLDTGTLVGDDEMKVYKHLLVRRGV